MSLPPLAPLAQYFVSNPSTDPVCKWTCKRFTKAKNGLRASHWQSQDDTQGTVHALESVACRTERTQDSHLDDRFADYDSPVDVVAYTDQEYAMYLTDMQWSKEETDYLLGLVREFDTRFPVVWDRYDFPGGPSRSLEDLRGRYSEVNRKLIVARASPGDSLYRSQLQKFAYDKYRDTQRRKNLLTLFNRTQEQVLQEEILFHELRRREAYEDKWSRDREEVIRALKDHEVIPTGNPLSAHSNDLNHLKKKRRMNEMESAQKKRRGSTESFSESEESGQYKQKPSSMVQLRSNKALIVRHTHTKLNLLLDEFRIPLKPTMATEAITDKYNEIREKGLGILDLRKQVEKVEHDLKVVQAKRVALESGGEPPPPEKKDAARKRPMSSKGTPREVKRSRGN